MAIPTVQATAPTNGLTTLASTTSATITLAATQAGDILVLLCENAGAATAPTKGGTYTGTWTGGTDGGQINALNQGTSRGEAHWSRCTGNHSGQTIIISGNTGSCAAAVAVIRGARASGNPLSGTSTSAGQATTNAPNVAAFTTSDADCLVFYTLHSADNIAWSAQTKGGAAMTERIEVGSSGGNDSLVGMATSDQASAGTTGAFAGTHAVAVNKVAFAFAIAGQAASNWTRTPADTAGITDSTERSVGEFLTPADTAGVTDSPTPLLLKTVEINDGIGVADTQSLGYGLGVDDAAGVTDARLVEWPSLGVRTLGSGTLGDPMAVTGAGHTASPSDTAGITDAVAVGRELVIADALGVTDSSVRELAVFASIADTAGVTDATTVARGIAQALADTAGITDTAAPVVAFFSTVADAAGVTDARALVVAYAQSVTDTAGATDQTALVAAFAQAVADAAGITDSAATETGGGAQYTRELSDALGVTDSNALVWAFQQAVADAITATDTPATAAGVAHAIADALGASDSVAAGIPTSFTVPLADGLGITDLLVEVDLTQVGVSVMGIVTFRRSSVAVTNRGRTTVTVTRI